MLEQANDPRKEAMRIQVAAVAAQQAALTEEEIKLNRRRAALEQQEAQLVGHLEEKRRRLIEVRDEAREARAALREERDAFEAHVKETMATLAEARAEAQTCKQQAQADRQRLRELRQRLKKRWHRHWSQERAALQRRHTEMETIQGWLEAERARFQADQNTLNRGRLWFNGEMELGRRQLQDGWNTLHQEQARWQQKRDAEDAALQERARMLAEREQAVNIAVRELTEERRRWDRARLHLAGETEGLEARIANQRRKLLDHQTELALLPGIPPADEITEVIEESIDTSGSPVRPLPLRHDLTSRLAALEKLSTELADQRVHLTEQCERLLMIQQRWQEHRDHAAAEMEEASRLIQERDEVLAQREQDLDDAISRFAQRQADASYVHRYLESWQARLTARAAALEGEREREQVEMQGREDLAN